jgi:hypothetical protein
MDQELKAKWVAALRSGDYKQCKGKMNLDDTFCCLGVLRGLLPQELRFIDDPALLTKEQSLAVGLTPDRQRGLSTMNDSGNTFAEIADHIERNL